MSRTLQHVAAIVVASLLSGCTSSFFQKPTPSPTLYTLDDGGPAAVSRSPPAASAPTLIVGAPSAAAGYASSQLVFVRHAQQIEYFAFNRWVEPPSQLLQPLIAQALEQTGAFRAVLTAPTAVSAPLRLDTELVRLQQDFSTTPSRVRLTLRAVLMDSATRSVIASRRFETSVAAASDDPQGGVIAAQTATRQLLAELAAFCAEASVR